MKNQGKSRSKLGSKRQLPSGKWLVRVTKGTTRSGNRKEISKTCNTEQEADKLIISIAANMGKNSNYGDSIHLDDYFEMYFIPSREKRQLANATINKYKHVYYKRIQPIFGSTNIDEIDYPKIQPLLHSMTHDTARCFATTVRAILRTAWADGFLDSKPLAQTFHYPKKKGKQLNVWTLQSMTKAMDAIKDTSIETIFLLMLGGGLRREEAYPLKWNELSFKQDEQGGIYCFFTINKAQTIEDGLKEAKTQYSNREIIIGDPFARRLYELRDLVRTQNKEHKRQGYVCLLSLDRVHKSWKIMWEEKIPSKHDDPNQTVLRGRMLKAQVPFIPMTRLRATHETLMQQAGIKDTLNARIHGRSQSSQIGYKHYLNPQVQAKLNAASALEDMISKNKVINLENI